MRPSLAGPLKITAICLVLAVSLTGCSLFKAATNIVKRELPVIGHSLPPVIAGASSTFDDALRVATTTADDDARAILASNEGPSIVSNRVLIDDDSIGPFYEVACDLSVDYVFDAPPDDAASFFEDLADAVAGQDPAYALRSDAEGFADALTATANGDPGGAGRLYLTLLFKKLYC